MADKIVFDYDAIRSAIGKIQEISENYKNHGNTFVSAFRDATIEWEGESKTQMLNLIEGDVNQILTSDIPNFINALAELLNSNLEQVMSADQQIADSIPKQVK